MTTSVEEMKTLAREIRGQVVQMSHAKKTPHLGSSLSCVDIVVAAYWGVLRIDPQNPWDPGRDRFILSKGHAATTLYAALARRGYYDPLACWRPTTRTAATWPNTLPAVRAGRRGLDRFARPWPAAGLGHGPGGRIQGRPYRCFVLMSDGECEEGTVWEAALFAAAQKIDNVAVIIDYNKWQATGRSNEVMALGPLVDKWRAFGWSARELDGHDIAALWPRWRRCPTARASRWRSSPTPSRARAFRSWKTTTTGTIARPPPTNFRPRARSWGSHEKRIRRHHHRTGRQGRPRRGPFRRHRQPPLRRLQGRSTRRGSTTAAWPKAT